MDSPRPNAIGYGLLMRPDPLFECLQILVPLPVCCRHISCVEGSDDFYETVQITDNLMPRDTGSKQENQDTHSLSVGQRRVQPDMISSFTQSRFF